MSRLSLKIIKQVTVNKMTLCFLCLTGPCCSQASTAEVFIFIFAAFSVSSTCPQENPLVGQPFLRGAILDLQLIDFTSKPPEKFVLIFRGPG